jgi:hypothetical protein
MKPPSPEAQSTGRHASIVMTTSSAAASARSAACDRAQRRRSLERASEIFRNVPLGIAAAMRCWIVTGKTGVGY